MQNAKCRTDAAEREQRALALYAEPRGGKACEAGLMQNAECRMQNAECKMQNAECRMQNAKLIILNSAFIIYQFITPDKSDKSDKSDKLIKEYSINF